MQITIEEIKAAATEHADCYIDRMQGIAEVSFLEGAEWVLNLIKERMETL